MNPGITLDEAKRTRAAFEQAVAEGYPIEGTGVPGAYSRAATLLGLPPSTVRNRLLPTGSATRMLEFEKHRAETGEVDADPELPGFVVKTITTQRDRDGNKRSESIKQARAPGPRFELPEGLRAKAFSIQTDAHGRETQR